jgi:hypothetical protein
VVPRQRTLDDVDQTMALRKDVGQPLANPHDPAALAMVRDGSSRERAQGAQQLPKRSQSARNLSLIQAVGRILHGVHRPGQGVEPRCRVVEPQTEDGRSIPSLGPVNDAEEHLVGRRVPAKDSARSGPPVLARVVDIGPLPTTPCPQTWQGRITRTSVRSAVRF